MSIQIDEVLYCEKHPDIETTLRCNRCGRPMCTKCAVKTPVGYRCRECVRGQQDNFYTVNQADYAIGGTVALLLAALGAWLVASLNAGIFIAFFAGAIAGSLIANGVRRAVRRRRGRYMRYVVVAGIITGGIIGLLVGSPLLFPMLSAGVPLGNLFSFVLLPPGLFTGVAAVLAYGWFIYGR